MNKAHIATLVAALLTGSTTSYAQYDPTWSNMLQQNQKDIDTLQACSIQHDQDACANFKRRMPQIQEQNRMLEDYSQFQGAINQSDQRYNGISNSMDEMNRQNEYSFDVQQANGWEAEAQAARASGDYQTYYNDHLKAIEWTQRADELR